MRDSAVENGITISLGGWYCSFRRRNVYLYPTQHEITSYLPVKRESMLF